MGKHAPGRDVPHGRQRGPHAQRSATRVRKEDGTSFENRAREREPKRLPLCMLLDDLDAKPMPEGIYGMYPAVFIPKILPWLACDRSAILHVCSGGRRTRSSSRW